MYWKIASLFIFLSWNTSVSAQKKQLAEGKTYFGIYASPVIPTNFIGDRTTKFLDSSGLMESTFRHNWGYTFGATARFGITKSISIETGLAQVRRFFTATAIIADSNINRSQQLAFSNYDVPINGLLYVQLSEKWFADGCFGISITHQPYDSGDTILVSSTERIQVLARRVTRTYFAANAGLGFEFRTEKKGTFYLGGSVKIPFKPIFIGQTIYSKSGSGNKLNGFGAISAPYFCIDFKYFLPNIKKKNN